MGVPGNFYEFLLLALAGFTFGVGFLLAARIVARVIGRLGGGSKSP